MKKLTLVFWMLSLVFFTQAQDYENLDYYLQKYPGDNIVNSLISMHLTIGFDADGELEIIVTDEERAIYLNDNAAKHSSGSVSHSEHYDLKEIEAFTLLPSGSKFKKIKVDDFATKTEFSPGIFHNGTESKNFIYPSLKKGAISVKRYTKQLNVPQLLSGFYLEDYYPTEQLQITIEVENGIELNFSYVNADDAKYKPTITEGKKGKIYKWDLKDIPAFKYDSDAPSITFYTPHIVPRIASYQKDGKQVKLLGDVGDLYNWYYSLVEETNKEASEEIKMVVDSLLNGVDDELEKISKIYYWAQDNIRYVAFEEGMQGFIPDDGKNVCSKKYGDCKGITSLLYTMMDYADLDAYFTWVGTRDRPYSYYDVPAPIVDNHMILTYKHNDEYHFIDGTSNTSPIGEPTAFIQGKEVLIGIDEGEYKIIEVPINSYDYTTHSDTVFLDLGEDDVLKGSGVTSMSGFYDTNMKGYLKRSSKEEQKRFLESYLEKGHNKFELDTFLVSDYANRKENMQIAYDFSLEDYVSRNEDEVYINLSLEKEYMDFDLNKNREVPYEVSFKSKNNHTVILNIPDGYTASYLPESKEFKKDHFGFSYNVSQKGNQIIQRFEIYDDFLLLDQNNFEDWNKMIRSIKKVYRESVILKKNK